MIKIIDKEGIELVVFDSFVKIYRDLHVGLMYYHLTLYCLEKISRCNRLVSFRCCNSSEPMEISKMFDQVDNINARIDFYKNQPDYFEKDELISVDELLSPLVSGIE